MDAADGQRALDGHTSHSVCPDCVVCAPSAWSGPTLFSARTGGGASRAHDPQHSFTAGEGNRPAADGWIRGVHESRPSISRDARRLWRVVTSMCEKSICFPDGRQDRLRVPEIFMRGVFWFFCVVAA